MRRWLSFILLVFATLAFGHGLEMRIVPTDSQTPVFHRNFPDVEAKPIPYFYNPFGNLISRTGNTPNNYLYCGEQYDSDLGLYYNRARYLNTDSGRFWTRDSFERARSDSLSLHKYLYARSNPISYLDPSGCISLPEVGIASTESAKKDAESAQRARIAYRNARRSLCIGAAAVLQHAGHHVLPVFLGAKRRGDPRDIVRSVPVNYHNDLHRLLRATLVLIGVGAPEHGKDEFEQLLRSGVTKQAVLKALWHVYRLWDEKCSPKIPAHPLTPVLEAQIKNGDWDFLWYD